MVQPSFSLQRQILIDPGEILKIALEKRGTKFRISSTLQVLFGLLDLLPKFSLILFKLEQVPSEGP